VAAIPVSRVRRFSGADKFFDNGDMGILSSSGWHSGSRLNLVDNTVDIFAYKIYARFLSRAAAPGGAG
jgi:hypothetical protein